MEPMTLDEFEFKLIEFMHGIDFALQDPEVQENIRVMLAEAQGKIPADVELPDFEPAQLDIELVHRIAEYLGYTEELLGDIPAGATDETCLPLHVSLRCGLFIYGWVMQERNEDGIGFYRYPTGDDDVTEDDGGADPL